MKPKNFPARKVARAIAAKWRSDGGAGKGTTAREVIEHGMDEIDGARGIRTKKQRVRK